MNERVLGRKDLEHEGFVESLVGRRIPYCNILEDLVHCMIEEARILRLFGERER